jgi:hypothetical protein
MAGPFQGLAANWSFNDRLLGVATEGFSASDWRHRPEQGGNSAHWIVGHLARCRRDALRAAGDAIEAAPWEDLFADGKPCRDASGYPPVADLAREFREGGTRLAGRLGALTAEDGERALPGLLAKPLPTGRTTLGGLLDFLYFHETYHLGQLGYIRRLRGHKGFA